MPAGTCPGTGGEDCNARAGSDEGKYGFGTLLCVSLGLATFAVPAIGTPGPAVTIGDGIGGGITGTGGTAFGMVVVEGYGSDELL